MKIRESGMPEENLWNNFFNIELICNQLQINSEIKNVVEIGCGYGTFTIPVSKLISGKIYAFDLEKDMISIVRDKVINQKIENIELFEKDVLKDKIHLSNNSVEYVMMFNILHHEKPEEIIDEAYRILKKNGKLGIIHWRSDIETPRGPSLNIRPKPKQMSELFKNFAFSIIKNPFIIEPFHYGILLEKIK